MKILKKELETICTEHWWNMGTKTLSFKGPLKELLEKHNITFSIKKTETNGIYQYYFKSAYNITFKERGTVQDFTQIAKRFIQMELVRMGDKSTLYVPGLWRPTVTVNH